MKIDSIKFMANVVSKEKAANELLILCLELAETCGVKEEFCNALSPKVKKKSKRRPTPQTSYSTALRRQKALKLFMEEQDLNCTDVADLCGVASSHISQIIRGHHNCGNRAWEKISQALGF